MPNYLKTIFDLHADERDRSEVLEDVSKNVEFRGANLWILACAIFIASIGLNVNSPAVIIGAMLISPLMGPIVGAGVALAIFDFTLLKKSMRNLALATIVSLTVSALYFLISPFKDIQSEILARTAPNIYDVLIAFCGGIVGVIALTRVEKGNPIPGVAIATALMPPLCTSGFGLATGNWSYFLGAFYLFAINCTFIAVSTFLIIKYLKYPAKKQVDEKQQRLVRHFITVLIVIMLVPSTYLAYNLYKEQGFRKKTDAFVNDQLVSKGYTVVYKKTVYNSSPKTLELAFLSRRFDSSEVVRLNRRLNQAVGEKMDLVIRQDSTDKLAVLKGDILNELNQRQKAIVQTEMNRKASQEITPKPLPILKEIRNFYPQIQTLSIVQPEFANEKDSLFKRNVVLFSTSSDLKKGEKEKIESWISERLKLKNITLYQVTDER